MYKKIITITNNKLLVLPQCAMSAIFYRSTNFISSTWYVFIYIWRLLSKALAQ